MNLIKYLVVLIIVLSTTNFGMYVLYNEQKDTYKINMMIEREWEFDRGFDEGLQYQQGFLQESGVLMKANIEGNIKNLMKESRDLVQKNRYSGYPRGLVDGIKYHDMNISEPEWYPTKPQTETVYIHDSKMDNDTKWRYYWAGVLIQQGRNDEFNRDTEINAIDVDTRLQESFYFLGRCQMYDIKHGYFDRYYALQNKTYYLLNQSWDFYTDSGYHTDGCRDGDIK